MQRVRCGRHESVTTLDHASKRTRISVFVVRQTVQIGVGNEETFDVSRSRGPAQVSDMRESFQDRLQSESAHAQP